MRFEKWQALGNDYAIVEQRELPFELTPERVRALCAPHTGLGADGVLLLRETDERGFVAELRIFNPDGSEAELSGNGVREAVMYLRRSGWTDADSFSIAHRRRRGPAAHHRPDTCTVDMGRARLRSRRRLPVRRRRRHRHADRGRPRVRLPVRAGRQPAVRDRGPRGAGGARPACATVRRSSATSCSRSRTNVSFWRRTGDGAIRARIFERGVGETMSSGTGATGAAVAAVLRGVGQPGDRAPRRRRARGRGGRGSARGPDRLGQARLHRERERRADGGAACNRVAAWTACPRTCSPSSSARSPRRRPPAWT